MTQLSEVREALKDRAETVPGLTGYAHVPDVVVTPAFVVDLASPFATYAVSMGDTACARWRLVAYVLTSRITETVAQEDLDDLVSPDGPLITALLGDQPDGIEVMSVVGQQYGPLALRQAEYLGFSLLVEVEA